MKNTLLFGFILLTVVSCKKEMATETTEQEISPPVSTAAARIPPEDCNYVQLTLNAQGLWEAYFGNTVVKFSNLHIRNDGRLYGQMYSAETNNIITGNDGYARRDFAFEKIMCTGSPSVTKEETTMTYSQFVNTANGNTSYLFYQNNISYGMQFSMYVQTQLSTGTAQYNVSTMTYKNTSYNWNTDMSCSGTSLILGKLVAKGVVQQPNGTFTYTEFGIAPHCYKDPMVAFYAWP